MKLLNSVLLSSSLVLSLCAMDKSSEIIEYDKENGFIYYADGSVYMIDNDVITQTKTEDLETIESVPTILVNETTLQEATLTQEEKNLEIIQTIPLDQPINDTIKVVDSHPLIKTSISTQTYTSYKPTKKANNGKFIGNVKLLHVIDGEDNGSYQLL